MRTKSEKLIESIRDFADRYYAERRASPSVRTIAAGVGVSPASVQRYLVYMDSIGAIRYDGEAGEIRTRATDKLSSDSSLCPIAGSIPCGSADEREQCIREYVPLPTALFGRGDFYILTASGDSMVDEGIEDGDMAVIRRDREAGVGDVIAALTEDGESTLKVYGGVDAETGEARLLYANAARYPGREIRVRGLVSQGVLSFIIKKR